MREERNILNSDVEIPEVVLKKADDALAQIRESTKPVRKAKKESRFQGGFRYAQAAAIACAVLVGAGGITVTAAVVHHLWSRGMQGNIQATEEQQKDLAERGMVTQFDQSAAQEEGLNLSSMEVTSEGITVKPMELIADGHFVHAAFQVSGYDLADGEEPCFENVVVYTGEDENAQDGWVNMGGGFYDGIVSNNNGEPVYEDGTPLASDETGNIVEHYKAADGTLEYVMTLYKTDPDESLLGQTLHVHFENLGTVEKTEFMNGIGGTWEFDIPVSGKDAAKSCELNTALENVNVTVRSAAISPISIRVDYEVTGELQTQEDDNGLPNVGGVVLKDGSRVLYLLNGGQSGYQKGSDTHAYLLATFDRVIDVDQVQSLLFRLHAGDQPEEYVTVDLPQ